LKGVQYKIVVSPQFSGISFERRKEPERPGNELAGILLVIMVLKMMNVRLIIAIITSLLDEAAILAVILWGLPKLGIKIPLWGTILCIVAFAVFAVVSFRIGSRTLRRKAMIGFTDMVGTEGIASGRLNPDGLVKIESELWAARSEKGLIEAGARVVVTAQKGLKLVVKSISEAK
jgi:membrane protein implicated in regulation of membrane protease activity